MATKITDVERQGSIDLINHIAPKLIKPDPSQPRRHMDPQGLKALAASIKANGQLQPITVTPAGQSFLIITGERRWKACKMNRAKTVACIVRDTLDGEQDGALAVKFHQMAENNDREPLGAMDLAYFIAGLRKDFGLSDADIAKQLKSRGMRKMTRTYVANTRRLVDLPDTVQQLIINGHIKPSHGKLLLQLQVAAPELIDDAALNLAELAADLEFNSRQVSLPDIEKLICNMLLSSFICLSDWSNSSVYERCTPAQPGYSSPTFDPDGCKGCKSCISIKQRGGLISYCKNPAGFIDKNNTALAANAASFHREAALDKPAAKGVAASHDVGSGREEDAGRNDQGTPAPNQTDLRAIDKQLAALLIPLIEGKLKESGQASQAFFLWALCCTGGFDFDNEFLNQQRLRTFRQCLNSIPLSDSARDVFYTDILENLWYTQTFDCAWGLALKPYFDAQPLNDRLAEIYIEQSETEASIENEIADSKSSASSDAL